jgi:hypothetical protein
MKYGRDVEGYSLMWRSLVVVVEEEGMRDEDGERGLIGCLSLILTQSWIHAKTLFQILKFFSECRAGGTHMSRDIIILSSC